MSKVRIRFVAAQLAAGTCARDVRVPAGPAGRIAGVAFVLFALGAELFGGAGALAGALWLRPFVLGIVTWTASTFPFP